MSEDTVKTPPVVQRIENLPETLPITHPETGGTINLVPRTIKRGKGVGNVVLSPPEDVELETLIAFWPNETIVEILADVIKKLAAKFTREATNKDNVFDKEEFIPMFVELAAPSNSIPELDEKIKHIAQVDMVALVAKMGEMTQEAFREQMESYSSKIQKLTEAIENKRRNKEAKGETIEVEEEDED